MGWLFENVSEKENQGGFRSNLACFVYIRNSNLTEFRGKCLAILIWILYKQTTLGTQNSNRNAVFKWKILQIVLLLFQIFLLALKSKIVQYFLFSILKVFLLYQYSERIMFLVTFPGSCYSVFIKLLYGLYQILPFLNFRNKVFFIACRATILGIAIILFSSNSSLNNPQVLYWLAKTCLFSMALFLHSSFDVGIFPYKPMYKLSASIWISSKSFLNTLSVILQWNSSVLNFANWYPR